MSHLSRGSKRPAPSEYSQQKRRARNEVFHQQRCALRLQQEIDSADAMRRHSLEVAAAVVAAQRSLHAEEQRRREQQLHIIDKQLQSVAGMIAGSSQQAV